MENLLKMSFLNKYSRTRLVRTRDTTYFSLVRTFSEREFIFYIDAYVISTRLVRTYG